MIDPMSIIAAGQAAFRLFQEVRAAVAAREVTRPDGTVITVEEFDALCEETKRIVLAAGDEAQARLDGRTPTDG